MSELNEELLDAARYGDLDDVKEALSRGADVDFADESGKTALHMAAANGHADVIRLLLNGATTESSSNVPKTARKAADPSPRTADARNTPLHWACLNGHARAVTALLEGGADPAALNAVDRTPIDEALGGPHQDAILGVMREFAARGGGGGGGGGGGEGKTAAAAEAAEAEVEKEGVDADDEVMEDEEAKTTAGAP